MSIRWQIANMARDHDVARSNGNLGSCSRGSHRFQIPEELIARAREEYEITDRRLALLGEKLYIGPAWNMLLDLFLSEASRKQLSVSDLCLAARSSSATALRRLSMLEQGGLVARSADSSDARRFYINLTEQGWLAMLTLLRQPIS